MSNERPISPEFSGTLEEFVQAAQKGKSFMEALLGENERLKRKVLELETQWNTLHQVAGEKKKLEEELTLVKSRTDEIERENLKFVERYQEIQEFNDKLLNLYVSTYRLHSTLEFEEVRRHVRDMLTQLIGANRFYVCAVDRVRSRWKVMISVGEHVPAEGEILERPHPVLERVMTDGTAHFTDFTDVKELPPDMPVACLPLHVKGTLFGVINILRLDDRSGRAPTTIDRELIKLFTDHASMALVCAEMYSQAERKLKTVQGFMELLKTDEKKR